MFNLAYIEPDDDGQTDTTNPYTHGTWKTPDGSYQPPFRYALRWLGPTIDRVTELIRAEDYAGAWECYSELTIGERLALNIAPTKKGPWPKDVWDSMKTGGEFRNWIAEYERAMRQQQEENRHEKSNPE